MARISVTPHYSDGKANERSLAALIGTKGTAITREAQDAEPMRQWEDMRATTGVLDFLAELTMDVDDIREEANRLHERQEARSTSPGRPRRKPVTCAYTD
ncbi:hypothetical protein OG393_16380 [Streptomyces sp. NBC_01216]|uniref:hypothetical protein n=1 Tax=Streptomyces sp. NBC_01216 TaxID=2903778 RepID=UPI002E0D6370|nr:hypothetical protein OG393_16380 [Streptomyces sp. NBC_01216]